MKRTLLKALKKTLMTYAGGGVFLMCSLALNTALAQPPGAAVIIPPTPFPEKNIATVTALPLPIFINPLSIVICWKWVKKKLVKMDSQFEMY